MKSVYKYVPDSVKPTLQDVYDFLLRRLYYRLVDGIELLLGRREELVPPRSKIFVGKGDYKKVGQVYCQYFQEYCDLRPDERVLDVGCGIGRIAVPLTSYLSGEGEYWGFDIVREGIDWCRKHFSGYPNFHFQFSDVYNKRYNPRGTHDAKEYRFPYENDCFDFVLLTSVFTHMMPKDVANYLSEIARVLKPGGKCLITFFLANPESRQMIKDGLSSIDFKYEIGNCLTANKFRPEDAIAYDEQVVRELYEQCKLRIVEPIYYGPWCGRSSSLLTIQDIIVAAKEK